MEQKHRRISTNHTHMKTLIFLPFFTRDFHQKLNFQKGYTVSEYLTQKLDNVSFKIPDFFVKISTRIGKADVFEQSRETVRRNKQTTHGHVS